MQIRCADRQSPRVLAGKGPHTSAPCVNDNAACSVRLELLLRHGVAVRRGPRGGLGVDACRRGVLKGVRVLLLRADDLGSACVGRCVERRGAGPGEAPRWVGRGRQLLCLLHVVMLHSMPAHTAQDWRLQPNEQPDILLPIYDSQLRAEPTAYSPNRST
jgi:hypothetical protein